MGMLKEFKEFAVRGSVLDLAVGVIIGGAFGKVVSSLVDDVIMPPIGLILGNVDFTNLFINLSGSPTPAWPRRRRRERRRSTMGPSSTASSPS